MHAVLLELGEWFACLDGLGLLGIAQLDKTGAGLFHQAHELFHLASADDTGLVENNDCPLVQGLVFGVEKAGQGMSVHPLIFECGNLVAIRS